MTTGIPYLSHVCNAAVGCSAGCAYCFARRFAKRSRCPQCKTFTPHMHPERLKVLTRKKPSIIGISFGGELFDPKRPIAEIDGVLSCCTRLAWEQTLVFLTRQPDIVARYEDRFIQPGIGRNWWLGLTATTHRQLAD